MSTKYFSLKGSSPKSPSLGNWWRVLLPVILAFPLLLGMGQGDFAQAAQPQGTPTPVLRLSNPASPAAPQQGVPANPVVPQTGEGGQVEVLPVQTKPQAALSQAEIWPWGHRNPEPKAVYNAAVAHQQAFAGVNQVGMAALPPAYNMTSISQIGGASYRVTVKGDYAYMGLQYRLAILNVANPAAPVLMGMTGTWPDKVLGVDVDSAQKHAYVAAGNQGLRIIDLTNMSTPTESGYYNNAPEGGYAWDLKLWDSRVFIADGDAGLQIVDISNPKSPQKRGCFDTSGSAYDVDVFKVSVTGSADKIYAAVADETNGLLIIDVTNPNCSCPCPSGSNPNCPVLVGSATTTGRAVGVVVQYPYAYVAADESGLLIFDITNVTTPTLVGSYDTPQHAYSVAVSKMANVAYIADGNQDVIVVDISDPTKPTYKGSFGCCDVEGDCFANDIALGGNYENYAFLVDPAYGLRVLNAANPAKLSQVFIYNSPAYTYGVQYNGFAYITAGSAGLRVIEFPNFNVPPTPNYTDPREVGFFDTPGYAYSVDIKGSYAYVADGERGLRIVEINNPAAPHEVSYYDKLADARDVKLYQGIAYVADKNQGVQVIDVRDPENPVYRSSPPFNTLCKDARAVDEENGYIFVADGLCGLRMFDAADPEHNVALDTLGEALDVYVEGEYAYIAEGSGGGLQVVHVKIDSSTSPATLTLTPAGSYDTEGSANAVLVRGTRVYVADGSSGVRVYDAKVNSPDDVTLEEVAFYDTRGSAGNLSMSAADAQTVFTADGDGGFQILQVVQGVVTSKISGKVTLNGAALAGVSVSDGAGHTVLTNTSGEYEFSGLVDKSYTITPSKSGYTFSPALLSVTVPPDATNKNFSAVANCLTGQVVDIKGRAVPDVTVTISGAASYTVYTDASGNYSQCQVNSGRYTITPSKSKYTFYKSSETVDVPSSSQVRNFVGALPTSSPSGIITDIQPSYVWEAVKDAVRYHLLVNGPKGSVIDQWYEQDAICSGGLCIVKPDTTLALGKHSWQVQSYGPSGATAFGAQKNFTVSALPVVSLASPARTISETKPSYVWYALDGVLKYHLMVNSSVTTVIDQWFETSKVCNADTCSVKPEVVLAAGKYSWKVQAWAQTSDGPWSEAMEFTVQ